MPTIELKMINKFPACSPICFKHRLLWCPFLDSHRTTPLKYRCPFKMSDRVRPTYLTSMMMWNIITCRSFFNNQVNSEKEGCLWWAYLHTNSCGIHDELHNPLLSNTPPGLFFSFHLIPCSMVQQSNFDQFNCKLLNENRNQFKG